MKPDPRNRWELAQGLAEFILVLALMVIVVVAVLLFVGGGLDIILSTVGAAPTR